MHVTLSAWQKKILRLLAWGCLFAIVGAAAQNLAFAEERRGNAYPEET